MLDSNLQSTDFESHIKSGTSLVVHLTEPALDVYHLTYCANVAVDRVIGIETSQTYLFHPHVRAYFPKIITLSDDDHTWFSQACVNHSQPLAELSHYFRFQQLWRDGKLVKQWEQPYDKPMEKFKRDVNQTHRFFKLFGHAGVDWLKHSDLEDADWFWKDQFSTYHRTQSLYIEFLKWYALVPNLELQKFLNCEQ